MHLRAAHRCSGSAVPPGEREDCLHTCPGLCLFSTSVTSRQRLRPLHVSLICALCPGSTSQGTSVSAPFLGCKIHTRRFSDHARMQKSASTRTRTHAARARTDLSQCQLSESLHALFGVSKTGVKTRRSVIPGVACGLISGLQLKVGAQVLRTNLRPVFHIAV